MNQNDIPLLREHSRHDRLLSLLARFMVIWIPLMAMLATSVYMVYRAEVRGARAVTEESERQSLRLASRIVSNEFATVQSNLAYLADLPSLGSWFARNTTARRRRLVNALVTFARHTKLYSSLRFVDVSGKEVVRVNRHHGITVVAQDRLADVSGLAAFDGTKALAPGDIYISALTPLSAPGAATAILQVATPVADGSGRRRGIVLLDYDGRELLQSLHSISSDPHHTLWLIDSHGTAVMGPAANGAWGLLSAKSGTPSFASSHAAVWKAAINGPAMGHVASGGSLYNYVQITAHDLFNAPAGRIVAPQKWLLISHIPTGIFTASRSELAHHFILPSVFMALLLSIAAWTIALYSVRHRQAEHMAKASAGLFRQLLESAPDAILVCNQEGRIIMANAEVERLFGYERQTLRGNPIETLIPEEFRERHRRHRSDYIAAPTARPMGLKMALSGLRNDGTRFPVSVSLSPIQTEQGLLIFSDIRDISLQRQAEDDVQRLNRSLRQRNAELSAVNAELEAFSYSVSHDLRAPLRAIDGFSRMLLDHSGDALDTTSQDYLHRVRRGAQRMGELIDDLLTLSRVSRSNLSREHVDLGAMATDIIAQLQHRSPRPGLKAIMTPYLDDYGDPRLLKIVLENLIDNAWKFTAKKREPVIEFGRTVQQDLNVYYVRDNGAGFDMAFADKLFGAFQRLHNDNEYPGTGIGLATVQRIIHKHGGRIWSEAEIGVGATFHFTIAPQPHGMDN